MSLDGRLIADELLKPEDPKWEIVDKLGRKLTQALEVHPAVVRDLIYEARDLVNQLKIQMLKPERPTYKR